MIASLKAQASRYVSAFCCWWLTPRRTIAIGVLRFGLGILALLFFLQHVQDRHFLWGPDGAIDWPFYARHVGNDPLAIYAWSSSSTWSEAVYWLSILVCVWFLCGWFPRVSALVLFVCLRAAFQRNWAAIDGGHNILELVVFYLAFSPNPASSARITSSGLISRLLPHFRPALAAFDSITHNVAVVLILGQIWMLYFWSGFYKVTGHAWQDGTAIYYVMRVNEFFVPGVSSHFYESATIVTLLTYSTIMFQLAFPVAMWVTRVKPLLFVVAVSFHLGIAYFMGLALFSFTMIVVDLALFSDDAYRALVAALSGQRWFVALKPTAIQLD